MKTFVWVHGKHAQIVRAKDYDDGVRRVVNEILHSGSFLSPVSHLQPSERGPEAVALFDKGHSLHEITEPDLAREPYQGSLYF